MTKPIDLEPAALEACPFCNEKAGISYDGGVCFGECLSCHAEGPCCRSDAEAREAWNRRAARSAPEAGKAVPQYWREGTNLIEACLAKAVKADPLDVPMPLVGEEAALWHEAQAEAYRHALEMMGVPECMAALASPAPSGAAEPVAYANAGQLNGLADRPGDEGGVYIPLRKTSLGNFQMPLYAAPLDDAELLEATEASDLRRKLEEARKALEVFTRHYEPWMDEHGDDVQVSSFARHTFGELRRARALTTDGGPNG